MQIKPKTYGPLRVDSPTPEVLSITTQAGHRATGALAPQARGMSPSDLLIASVATCITISMRMAAQQMGLTLGRLAASAGAVKAADPPGRFERITVDVQCSEEVDPGLHGELLRRTKALCTVSNSLGAEVVLSLRSGVGEASATG